MMAPVILGVDPGLNGAFALVVGDRVHVWDMPAVQVKRGGKNKKEISPVLLAATLRTIDLVAESAGAGDQLRAYVEKVGAMPGQGVSSMFSFGRSLGLVEGALAALTIPVELVPPQTWRRAMAVREGKDGSRLRATELWPSQAGLFARAKDDGRAEAALIAAFGRKRSTQ